MNQRVRLNKLDRCILDRLQEGIPFVKRPWKKIAEELRIKEEFFLKRIKFIKKMGIVRRISATINPKEIGFSSTLVAVKIAPQKVSWVAKRLSFYDEITHNYQRESEYNLWFTLVAPTRRRILQVINQIKKDKDIKAILEFPAVKLFKIEVDFRRNRHGFKTR